MTMVSEVPTMGKYTFNASAAGFTKRNVTVKAASVADAKVAAAAKLNKALAALVEAAPIVWKLELSKMTSVY